MKIKILTAILISLLINHPRGSAMTEPSEIKVLPMDAAVFVAPFQKGPVQQPTLVSSLKNFKDQFGELSSHLSELEASGYRQVTQYFENGGVRAWILRSRATLPVAEDLHALLPVADQLGVLVLPTQAYSSLNEAAPLWHAAVEFVENTKGFLLADPIQSAQTPAEAEAWCDHVPELKSIRVAVFYPRLSILENNNKVWVSPSGSIAGLLARSELAQGVWVIPFTAKTSLEATGLEYSLTPKQSDELMAPKNQRPINPILFLNGHGLVPWGARTQRVDNNDGLYLPVVRTTEMIERSIQKGMLAYVHSPNNASTWVSLNSAVSKFLSGLWKAGALIGSQAADSYSVQIGLGTTMTAHDIQNGIMILAAHAALVKPAEFTSMVFTQQQIK